MYRLNMSILKFTLIRQEMSTVTFQWNNGWEVLYFSFKENNDMNIDTVMLY